MNFSKIFEDSEGYSSNESGWTTYLVSPEHKKDRTEDECFEDYYSIEERFKYKKNVREEDEGFDSDDSMASDASSGPPSDHQGLFHGYDAMIKHKISTKNQKLQEQKRKNDAKQMKYVRKDKSGSRRTQSGERSKLQYK